MQDMHVYVIGEIGQNHNGSVELGKKIIEMAALPVVDTGGNQLAGVDAIKLTKRDLKTELTASAQAQPYKGEHSYGRTYGEHRAALELSDQEHFELYRHAKDRGLQVVETLCAASCLSLLNLFVPDRLKIASRDITNLPLIAALAETKIPLILSTGMAGEEELEAAISQITRWHSAITILHCLSQYPAEYKNLNLNTIAYLRERYPQFIIGYSDHTLGISAAVAAISLGAQVIEKHITLSRGMKGSDHQGSLGPDGLYRMVRDVRHFESALGKKALFKHPASVLAERKLGRSIAAARNLAVGHVVTEADLKLLSPGTGLPWTQRQQVVGRVVSRLIRQDELVELPSLETLARQQAATTGQPTQRR